MDLLWSLLHTVEDSVKSLPQLILADKVTIVSSLHSGVMPQSFGGIELGGIRREQVNFQPPPVFSEPVPDPSILVVRGVVLN